MKLLGLTGGIGMGKSAAADLLQHRGLPVVDTDQLARDAVQPGQPAWAELRDVFGPRWFDPAGRLRRAELAELVFQDETRRRQLEAILHPRIRSAWKSQVESWRQQNQPAAFVVIPLLFETGAETEFHSVICVACSQATQFERLAPRRWSPAQIEQRNRAQWPVERKIAAAQFVLWNEGHRDILAAQLDRLLLRILTQHA